MPYKGVLQITTDKGSANNVCWGSLLNNANDVVCRYLGYQGVHTSNEIAAPKTSRGATFPGRITCNGLEKYLSQCSVTDSLNKDCDEFTHIQCKYIIETKLSNYMA